ncbi:hypothetical protein JN11_00030 [Mucilaginibacter frigoritolerans]|uniref:Uncharacterized protein n=1 Tax=Mucilaginibacter frigoritolerans TaxID=652788 RepID=A0A562UEU7_9SPHI|nr:hypothetical protein [Mucilaginibacter frigoritolerans]TWJ04322.1 hypothetical protein JN11_00030 [Mucilaginibacter frigoritolerans]
MKSITITDDLQLVVENCDNKARLIVYKDGVENVCRKEGFGKLQRFITSDEKTMFGGRLRLHKNMEGIAIEIKGKIEGVIKAEDFLKLLSDAI